MIFENKQDYPEIADYCDRAIDVASSVFKANNLSKMLKDNVIISWNNLLVACAGRAYYNLCRIELSKKLFMIATPKQRDSVVAHEAGHIVAWHQFQHAGHGPEFMQIMQNAGYKPFAKHDIYYGVPVYCGCTNDNKKVVSFVTKNISTRIKNGSDYACLNCNKKIRLVIDANKSISPDQFKAMLSKMPNSSRFKCLV